ncbi:MAG: VacJ family lipoprotein [Magnetospirillum sp.]|nr:VacJ family lipoprotein [Magnetospirillum sp.]
MFGSNPATTTLVAMALSIGVLAGCADAPPESDPEARAEWKRLNDPLEPSNRAIFDFNMAADRRVMKPVAQAYEHYVPQYGRDRIHDFLDNLRAPLTFANDVLQGDVDGAVQTFIRFTFNTGFGALGLFDLAGEGGVPYHSNDLGATFAVWGAGEGPYLVLPILGPSNPRDAIGMAGEFFVDPFDYRVGQVGQTWAVYARAGSDGIDRRQAALAPLDDVERNSIDFYASVRSLYRQHREAEIHHRDGVAVPEPGYNLTSAKDSEISRETN